MGTQTIGKILAQILTKKIITILRKRGSIGGNISENICVKNASKEKMKQRSKRAKATRLQNFVRLALLKAFPHLKKKDVMVPTDGQNGPDIILSRIAKKLCPYNWELKNQQKMATVYKWHKQASKNTKLTPVVVCKMNTRDPLVILDLDHFMSLIR